MSNVKQKVQWDSPSGKVEATLVHTVQDVTLQETRVLFDVPVGSEHIIVRAFKGRLYRQCSMPDVVHSSASTLAAVADEAFEGLEHAFECNGMLWVQCAEPGYKIHCTQGSVEIRAVIPTVGQDIDLFSVAELSTVQAEALEIALNHKQVESVPGILNFQPIIVTDEAVISRPTVLEKLQARAARLDSALEVAESLRGAPAAMFGELLSLPR